MKSHQHKLAMRQVHLDFHTSPAIGDVGVDFDARKFAVTMKRAHVNSVTVFAKCHHGHLYYNTARPERHPGLKRGFDLLGRQIEALHREGIRAPIYLSVQCDEYAANANPHWVACDAKGAPVKRGEHVFEPGWQILDMSSPYQEFLVEQTREVLRQFKPVDGIFFDMCWDQPSTSKWAIAGMVKANLNPESEADRMKYSRQVSFAYMKRLGDLVKRQSKNGTVFFNGRVLFNTQEEEQFQTQVEIEALPSGGWGYMYFPKNVRFVRTFDRPYLGMTARFHKSWADFGGLKPYAALEYETSQMVAHGAACSIGDQMHPRGELDRAAYELIGRAYERVEQREPWLIGAKPIAEIGVLVQPDVNADIHDRQSGGSEEGATRMLTQLKHQFNFVSESGDWDEYELLVLPDRISMTKKLIDRLRRHIAAGKAVLATGTSGLSEDAKRVLLPGLGIVAKGFSPFTATYVRFGQEIGGGIPQTDHVMYDRSVRVVVGGGAESLAKVVEPYFERTWDHFSSHHQTPPQKPSRFSAAVQRGRVGYIPYPVFSSYATHANLPCRWLVSALIDRLLPEAMVRVKAPSSTEVSVTRQKGRTVVHLLQYCPERRGKNLDVIEDVVPLFNVELSLRCKKKPSRVYQLNPQPTSIDFQWDGKRANVVVLRVLGHEMIVFE